MIFCSPVEGTEVLDVEPLGLVVEVVVLDVVAVVPVVVLRLEVGVVEDVPGDVSSPLLLQDARQAAATKTASQRASGWRRGPSGGAVTRHCLLGQAGRIPPELDLPPPRPHGPAVFAGEPTHSQSGGWSAS